MKLGYEGSCSNVSVRPGTGAGGVTGGVARGVIGGGVDVVTPGAIKGSVGATRDGVVNGCALGEG